MKRCEKGRDQERGGRGRGLWTTHKGEEKEALIEMRREKKRREEGKGKRTKIYVATKKSVELQVHEQELFMTRL